MERERIISEPCISWKNTKHAIPEGNLDRLSPRTMMISLSIFVMQICDIFVPLLKKKTSIKIEFLGEI